MKDNGSESRVVILTAIPIEYQIVRAHLRQLHEELHPSGTIYEHGVFEYETHRWQIILAETGMGNVNSAFEAERAITHFAPDYVFFLGVAGGLKDVQLGDVVVATKVYAYESGKESASFHTRPDVSIAPYPMVQRAKIEAKKLDWLHHLKGPVPNPPPRVFVAPIVAGEKVINSAQSSILKFLRDHYGDALAVEMEGYGFLRVIYASQQIRALVIRGISDLIEGKSAADAANYQALAAEHACAFALEMLLKLGNDAPRLSSGFDAAEEEKASSQTPSFSVPVSNDLSANKNAPATEGRVYLRRGQAALLDGDYPMAKQHLAQAALLLPTNQLTEENAQMNFLQALILLDGQRPQNAAPSVIQSVQQSLETAIRLHSSFSYLYTLALVKYSCAVSGSPILLQEAQELMRRANPLAHSLKDEENLQILSRCQPHLVSASYDW